MKTKNCNYLKIVIQTTDKIENFFFDFVLCPLGTSNTMLSGQNLGLTANLGIFNL
jgi:hypothetical protein